VTRAQLACAVGWLALAAGGCSHERANGDGGAGSDGGAVAINPIPPGSLTQKLLPGGKPDLMNLGRYDFAADVIAGAQPIVGDFDGDGRHDLVQLVPGAQTLSLCTSTNSGWSCRRPAARVPAGAVGAAGDVDGDHRSDVVMLTSGELSVCLATAGDWSCAAPPATVLAGAKLLVGDFDGDGQADAAQVTPSQAALCLSTGSGSGWSCSMVPLSLGANAVPLSFDADADGKSDLVFFDGTTVTTCLAASSFQCTAAPGALPGTTTPLVGDVDQDGLPELIGAAAGGQVGVCALTPNVSCRQATLSSADGSPLPSGVPMVADVNNDDRVDLLFGDGSAGALQLCLGRAGGTFDCVSSVVSTMPTAAAAPASGNRRLAPGVRRAADTAAPSLVFDFNGDGRYDLITIDGSGVIHVLLSAGAMLGVNLLLGDDYDCCTAHGTPGCKAVSQEQDEVCADLPECCTVAWDSFCAQSALSVMACKYIDLCGDGACGSAENYYNCPDDCPGPDVCGDGVCGRTENAATCSADCQSASGLCEPSLGSCVRYKMVAVPNSADWIESIDQVTEAEAADSYGNACPSDGTDVPECVFDSQNLVSSELPESETSETYTTKICSAGQCSTAAQTGIAADPEDMGLPPVADGGIYEAPDGCTPQICDAVLDQRWCSSLGSCVLAAQCPPLDFFTSDCDCCLYVDPLGGECEICDPKMDVFIDNCPHG